MTAIYECERCDKPVDTYESLCVRQALINKGQGVAPGFEPWECLGCVTDEPPIRFITYVDDIGKPWTILEEPPHGAT